MYTICYICKKIALMKKIYTLLYILLLTSALHAQSDFNSWFVDKTLRMDYSVLCDAKSQEAAFSSFHESDSWGGEKFVVDKCDYYGDYYMQLSDALTDKILYTYSYSNLTGEWQSTEMATETKKVFRESVIMPMPKKKSVIKIYKQDSCDVYQLLLNKVFDPYEAKINYVNTKQYKTILQSNDTEGTINFVILPEWYSENETEKFEKDAAKVAKWLSETEPYSNYKDKFNVYAVLPDGPTQLTRALPQTKMNFKFNTLNIERYIASFNIPQIYNNAQSVPFRHVIVLINTYDYGGSGFYNTYTCLCIDNEDCQSLFLHEFGHAFAGLGDEYEGNVTYKVKKNNCEPRYPNLTNLTNFSSKWEKYVDAGAPIPTPITRTDIEIGAYEGGGYSSKGIYRPSKNCRMRTKDASYYCKICHKIIEETLQKQTATKK